MSEYMKRFNPECDPVTSDEFIIIYKNIRFSVLTPYLIRVERDDKKEFCNEPSQSVLNRNFDKPFFKFDAFGDSVTIKTEKTEIRYSTSQNKLISVTLDDGRTVKDFSKGNLKGTCRTLDNVNGKTSLEDGIISKNGVAVLNDSKTLLLGKNGKIKQRNKHTTDIYLFCYGFNYREAVRDLFFLTGKPPLIPRFALGNWWSRYKAYTQNEYTELMERFIEEKIPVTVATIDMDWHWVDVVKRFGIDALDDKHKNNIYELFYNAVFPGWTGYSWNTDLFPDHKAFLNWLNDNGFKVTMNLHPASGCKFYEDAYEDFCEFMGIDKSSRKQIKFDITDEKFIEGYFRFLHHPHEDEGVAFWWIDWQQGKNSAIEGLDPLWALNHYHSIDISRNGKRPLILSRFAGAGSHRYPLGFSGDTVQTWESLDFQPYFTSTASNIGYSWWSHDIGGHCRGYRDDELYLRWVQYGVFSPINRLHSTSNEFMGKEPWMYNSFVEKSASDFLRLRHRLIPYLYSMNRLTAEKGKCLVEPMYYSNPRDSRAYECPNEFWFGTEMIVCPITEKADGKTGLASTKAYLPSGRYTDIFTGLIYNGNTLTELCRDQSSIPVLAKEGAIIPLSIYGGTNSIRNPEELEILISRGNNSFTLYEDDGESLDYLNGKYSETDYCVAKDCKDISFTISKAKGDLSLIPKKRSYTLSFIDISDCEDVCVIVDGKATEYKYFKSKGKLTVKLESIPISSSVKVLIVNYKARTNPDKKFLTTQIISKMKGSNDKKAAKFTSFVKNNTFTLIPKSIQKPLSELEELYY